VDTLRISIPEDRYVNKISMHAKGRLSGDVIINEVYRIKKGEINTQVFDWEDYYAPEYLILIEPDSSTTTGRLEIELRFRLL